MPRLRHKVTGAVVNVSDETAAALAADYEPIVQPRKAPAKRTAPPRSKK